MSEGTFTFTFTDREVQIIAAGLGELPLKHSMALVIRLKKEIDEQQQPKKPEESGGGADDGDGGD